MVSPQDVARGKQEFQTKCPEANLKSYEHDALIILTTVILKSVLSFRMRKNCFFLARAVGLTGKGHSPFPSITDTPSAWLSPRPTPSPPHVWAHTFSSTSFRSCLHSGESDFTRFCVKSRVSLRDSP